MKQLANGLSVSGDIRWASVEESTVLLDLRGGDYTLLDPATSTQWRNALAGNASSEADAHFARACVDRGFLTTQTSPIEEPTMRLRPPGIPLSLYACYALSAAGRNLKRGFTSAYPHYASIAKPRIAHNDPARLRKAERAFHWAENFFECAGAPDDCLPRAFALYQLLVYAGLSPQHHIGVRFHPFRAHAWVVCLGAPVADSPANVATFTTVALL